METKNRSYSEIFHSVYEIARRNSEIGIKINQIFENKNKQTTNKITVMEKEKLNLVEILKDVPNGFEFYSEIHGNVTFDEINYDNFDYPINVNTISEGGDEDCQTFTSDGRYLTDYDGECVLFPSKENRSWEGWKYNSLKEGAIVMAGDNATDWCLAKYVEGDIVELRGVKTRVKYIVPAKDFDFENIESNIHKSVV